MPRKKKHPARTPKFTRSRSREALKLSLSATPSSQDLTTYPDSNLFLKTDMSDMSQTTSISSSTPIVGVTDNINNGESVHTDMSLVDNEDCSGTEISCKDNELDQYTQYEHDSEYEHDHEIDDEISHDSRSGSTQIDNDSLFNSLQTHFASNILPLKAMFKDLLDGFNHQLRLEIKSDMKTLLESNRSVISEFKTQIDTKISKIDSKVDSNFTEIDQKIDTLTQKIGNIERTKKSISEDKLVKIDEAIASNISLHDKLNDHMKSTGKQFTEILAKEEDLIKSIDFLNKEVRELREENESLKQKNANLEVTVDNQGTHNRRLKTQFNAFCVEKTASEVRQRKLNLIFEGLSETQNENPKQLITELLQKSGDLPNAADIDVTYRLGKPTDGNNRPILVSFNNQAIKDNILKHANKIKQVSGYMNLWINRDLPEITRRQTANTRRCFNLMKANKNECLVHGTSITYKKRVYQYKDLNQLPAGSRLEDTRQIPCENGTGICFQGDLSYLSNFFPANVTYRNKEFVSSEQAFQWARATHANDLNAANNILESVDPFTIKKYGEEVGDSDTWKLIDVETLRTITLNKFKQNRRLGERLRTSDFTKFYECTTSLKWGTGTTLPASREIDTSTFTGSNLFGQILADVKGKLTSDHQKNISHSSTSTSN